MNLSPVGARIGLSGTFEFKDKDGVVLKTMQFTGSVPLADTGLTVEQAQQLIQQEAADGSHD